MAGTGPTGEHLTCGQKTLLRWWLTYGETEHPGYHGCARMLTWACMVCGIWVGNDHSSKQMFQRKHLSKTPFFSLSAFRERTTGPGFCSPLSLEQDPTTATSFPKEQADHGPKEPQPSRLFWVSHSPRTAAAHSLFLDVKLLQAQTKYELRSIQGFFLGFFFMSPWWIGSQKPVTHLPIITVNYVQA